MKRIVFSLFQSKVDKVGFSVTDYKANQFNKWHDQLIKVKKDYADLCNADFKMHYPDLNNFVDLQFEKIRLLEQYAERYDEVLYLDFDIIPSPNAENIFNNVDISKICMYPLIRKMTFREMNEVLVMNEPNLDSQNMFVKTCAKNAMLLLDEIDSSDKCYNTGVIVGNSNVIKSLQFTDQLDHLHQLLSEAREDNVFPEEVYRHFVYNNEVYMTYLVEKNNIPFYDLSSNWNFILDDRGLTSSSVLKYDLLHVVNKDFDIWLENR